MNHINILDARKAELSTISNGNTVRNAISVRPSFSSQIEVDSIIHHEAALGAQA